ncbi:MAG: efflux RND transporter permease subunit [bacterium]
MSLSAVSIHRPVLSIVMSITIVIFGIIGYTYLGVREFPSIDPPIITVSTSYVGANADVVEAEITEPLEESINGIAGIRTITSTSRDGRSNIKIEFNLNIDLEVAANDVRDKVSRVQRSLPPDIDPPTVSKSDADANPIIFLSIKSDKRDLMNLSDISERLFKERLQTIAGVSEVRTWGLKKYSMRLWLDPTKMASFGITPMDIRNILVKENIELPSGRIEGTNTELTIRTMGRFKTLDDFSNLIIKDLKGKIVRLSDVGFAEIYPENDRTLLKRDGIPMVGVAVTPQPGSNHIAIADEFYKRIEDIKKDLSDDIEVGIGFDNTIFIRESIKEVEQTVYVAFILVILIIFFFLREWRTTIIPILAIPISLIGTFFVMYLFNFSINVLTLLGIVLAIGLVVDDAIVVLENIYRKVEDGMPAQEAGIKGSGEIFFAVISTTVSLVAVFLPIMFLQGLTGRLFREFGIVIATAVIISAFVALTLTPMLSTRFLKSGHKKGRFYKVTEPFFDKLELIYKNSLNAFLQKRWLAFIIISFSLFIIIFIANSLQTELAPIEDRGGIRVNCTAVEGASFDFMQNYMDEVVNELTYTVPEAETIISMTAPGFGSTSTTNSGNVRIRLKPLKERISSQQDIATRVSSVVSKLVEARSFVIQEQSISTQRSGLPVQFVIQAPNFEKLQEFIPKFVEEAKQNPTFDKIDVDLKFSKPELVIDIDRLKARELGISTSDIAQTLQFAMSGQRYGFFILNGKQYQVIGQVERKNRSKPMDIASIYVRSSTGQLIQLDNLITYHEKSSPPQRYRYNRYVSATISASLAPNKTISDGIKEMQKTADKILDDSFSTALDGASKDFVESSSSLLFTFGLALILIYLVLAAQFESFRDPFIIMLTVPMAIAGAMLTLWIFNQTLNIFSEIGSIMLIGLVTKNGILIVEFANQKKATGLLTIEAVKESAIQRLRPILMTSFSTILGTLPIALALGAGSESRVSMGFAVIGGLVFSTLLTLYVIPGIYSYVSDKKKEVSNVIEE